MKENQMLRCFFLVVGIALCFGEPYWIINYPSHDLTARCKDPKCGKGWVKSNSNWVLCKNASNMAGATLETESVINLPTRLSFPKKIFIVVKVNFSRCNPYANNVCAQKLKVHYHYTKKAKIKMTGSFSLKISKGEEGVYITKRGFIEDREGIESLRFEILSENFCGIIKTVKAYFQYCPANVRNLVWFPTDIGINKTTTGKCTKNAVKISGGDSLIRHCDSLGSANDSSSCVCEEGFSKINETCKACASNSFKPTIGNEACQSCPRGSIVNANKTKCQKCPIGSVVNADQTRCDCLPAYRKHNDSCHECPNGSVVNANQTKCDCLPMYRIYNDSCLTCPNGSRVNANQTRCDCLSGYGRYNQTNEEEPCFDPEPCLKSTLERGTLGTYKFPQIEVGVAVEFKCEHGRKQRNNNQYMTTITVTEMLSRKCAMTKFGGSEWTKLDLSSCKHSPCPEEHFDGDTLGVYHFPKTEVGQRVTFSCQYGRREPNTIQQNSSTTTTIKALSNQVTRQCVVDRNGSSGWAKLDLLSCKHLDVSMFEKGIDKINVTKENVESILSLVHSVMANVSRNASKIDVKKVVTVLENSMLVAESEEVFTLVISMFDDLANLQTSSEQDGASILKSLDSLVDSLVKALNISSTFSFSGTSIGFSIKAIPENYSAPLEAVAKTDGDTIRVVFMEKKQNLNGVPENFFLPQALFDEYGDNIKHVYSYVFKDSSLFVSNDSIQDNNSKMVAQTVDGHVMAMTVHNNSIKDLREPIEFTMKLSKNNMHGSCSFWKTEENYLHNRWSTDGCNTSQIFTQNNQRYVTCKCNHLTSFAVLFDVYDEQKSLLSSFELSLISQMGCYISIASLIISLAALGFLRELRRTTANKILINLCISLLLLLVTFISGIAYTKSTSICSSIATLLHMFVLSTFSWMCVEAVSLYRKAVRTFKNRGEGKIFFRTSFVFAWAVPLIIALVTKFTSYQSATQLQERTYCMITGESFKYGLLIPVSCMLALNIVLFIPILRKVQGHITTRSSFQKIPKPKRLQRRTRVTFSCTALLGLTWFFAYLSIGRAGHVFQWLFTLSNSLQGLFILFFHVLLNDRVISTWRAFFKLKRHHRETSTSLSLNAYRKDTLFWRPSNPRNGSTVRR